MEDRKIDELFSRLKDREIQPSLQAKEKLFTQMKAEEKKKSAWWIWTMAASFLLALGVTAWWTLQNNHSEIEDFFVENNIELEDKGSETILEDVQVDLERINERDLAVGEDKKEIHIQEDTVKVERQAVEVFANKTEEIAAKEELDELKVSDKSLAVNSQDKVKEDALQEQSLEVLLKPISDEDLDKLIAGAHEELALDKISDEHIYALLAQATKEINKDKENNKYLSLKAEELLADAEFEIRNERSLQKILERALEYGIVEVKNLFNPF